VFFTLHLPILYMGMCETVLVNVALNILFMLVDPIPESALLKENVTFVLGVKVLSRSFYEMDAGCQSLRPSPENSSDVPSSARLIQIAVCKKRQWK
jgi:hypothetical protein